MDGANVPSVVDMQTNAEKIGQCFRDALHSNYRSSTKSKRQRRRGVHTETLPTSSGIGSTTDRVASNPQVRSKFNTSPSSVICQSRNMIERNDMDALETSEILATDLLPLDIDESPTSSLLPAMEREENTYPSATEKKIYPSSQDILVDTKHCSTMWHYGLKSRQGKRRRSNEEMFHGLVMEQDDDLLIDPADAADMDTLFSDLQKMWDF